MKVKFDNITLYPAFAKKTNEEQFDFFRSLKVNTTKAQATKMHKEYLKAIGQDGKDKPSRTKSKTTKAKS